MPLPALPVALSGCVHAFTPCHSASSNCVSTLVPCTQSTRHKNRSSCPWHRGHDSPTSHRRGQNPLRKYRKESLPWVQKKSLRGHSDTLLHLAPYVLPLLALLVQFSRAVYS